METWAIAIPLVSLLGYGVLASIQLGVSILQYQPKLVGHRADWRVYLSPTWELTNVLLLGAFFLLLLLYPGTIAHARTGLADILAITATLMTARALLQMAIYYRRVPAGARAANALLVLLSLAVPAALSQIVVILLGGNLVDNLAASFSIGCVAVVATIALSLSFYSAVAPAHGRVARQRLSDARHRFVMLLAGLFTLVLPPVLGSVRPGLVSQNLIISLATISVVCGLGYLLAENIERRFEQFIILASYIVLVMAVLAFQQLPYIFYPNVTVASAFTAHAKAYLLMVVLVPGLLATLGGLIWLHHQTTTSLDKN